MTHLPPQPHMGDALPVEITPQVLDFLARRRSSSAVQLTTPAPADDDLADMLRLAARVPDHGKLTPWRFVVLREEAKARFAGRLQALAEARGDSKAVSKLVKLKTPPMCVVVVSSPIASDIPEWEQILSAGAVCTHLLLAAGAMGWGANWITDWYAYDAEATAILGLTGAERVAGFVLLGTASEPPLERVRPEVEMLTTSWEG